MIALLLWLACRDAPPPPSGVLLITVDTWRADHLDSELTPALWELAQSGQRHLQAWSPIGLTTPAHASLFTGQLPWEHGMRGNNHHGYQLSPEATTLAELFQEAGWDTAARVSAWPAGPSGGLEQGFESFEGPEEGEQAGELAVQQGMDWIRSRRGPWFLWVHLYEPHGPYTPSEEDRARAGRGEGDRGGYAGEVHQADRLLRPLLELGRKSQSVIAVTSDHGEILEEEVCGWQHERSSGDGALRIPLILSAPKLAPSVQEGLVGLTDLFPSLLWLAGLEDPGGHQALMLPGLKEGEPLRSAWTAESGYCDPACSPGCDPAGFQGKDRLVITAAGERLRLRPGRGLEGAKGLTSQLPPAALPPEGEGDRRAAEALGYLVPEGP